VFYEPEVFGVLDDLVTAEAAPLRGWREKVEEGLARWNTMRQSIQSYFQPMFRHGLTELSFPKQRPEGRDFIRPPASGC
jgi:hypothetical protein